MSNVQQHNADIGLALLAEQQRHLDARAQGATRRQQAYCLRLELRGALDPQRLQQALDQLVHRHTALAAEFVEVGGYRGLRQRQRPVAGLPLTLALQPASAEQRLAHEQQWLDTPAEHAEGLLQRGLQDDWHVLLAVPRQVADASSLALLYQELPAAYAQQAFEDDEPGQFAQYLEWRGEVLFDEDAPAGKAYWQQVLQAPALAGPPRLPWRREGAPSGVPGQVRSALAPALKAHLAGLGQPLEVVLQAAWWSLLARLGGRSQFLGAVRHDARADYDFFGPSLGVFEKTLPLALDIDLTASARRLLERLAAQLDQHRTWQEYWAPDAFAQLPAATVACARRRVLPVQQAAGLAWAGEQLPDSAAAFELQLLLESPAEGEVDGVALHYDAACYAHIGAETLLEQYLQLLHGIAAQPDAPLASVDLLGAGERTRLLAFNPAPHPVDGESLAQRVDHWARHTPDAVALVAGGQALSYAQLHVQAARLGGELLRQGVCAGDIVGLALPRSAPLVVAILAAWRVGAAYLPLDPSWPAARQAQIANQASAALVLVERLDADSPLAAFKRLVPTLLPASAELAPPRSPVGDERAYVLFTSGSTGQPKGVQIEHRQLLNYTAGSSDVLGLAQCKQFAFGSTVAADLGNTTLFGALFNGATLHIADDATMQSPQAFAGFLRSQAIDCLKIVPSHLAALLEADDAQVPATVVLGGEALGASLVQRIQQVRPDCRLFNHYGPTETTVGVLVHRVQPGEQAGAGVPLTQVIPNNQVFVLGTDQQLLASGELGELYVGGRQVCRGYLGGDGGADVFVHSPLVAGERLYRTGDLARYRPEGGVQLYGRRDQQVKLRGFRVELAEVEAQLLRVPEVSEAVVLVVQDELLAFVVPRLGADVSALGGLPAALAERLPAVMVPRQVRVLQQMPRLANGKIDRQALQQLPAEQAQAHVEPRDALEGLLANRMAQLVGRERLGIDQDFFAAGGHSLLVIKLVAGIRKLLQCEIHPGVVFDHPSVAALAEALRARETVPGQLLKLAQARLRLDAMSPEEKAALLEKARQPS